MWAVRASHFLTNMSMALKAWSRTVLWEWAAAIRISALCARDKNSA